MVDGIAHFLSATAGEHLRLLADAFEPVWCTGWEEKANEYLLHALGLDGPWPYLSFKPQPGQPGALEAGRDRRLLRHRPLAWIDDAHRGRVRGVGGRSARLRAPTLLVTTGRRSGSPTGR